MRKTKEDLRSGRLSWAELWRSFEELALSAPHSDSLGPLVELGRRLPNADQVKILIAVTNILVPSEWPVVWHEPRLEILSAIEQILDALGPLDSAPGERQSVAAASGYAMFAVARLLLSRPCSRADLPAVAALCNSAVVLLTRAEPVSSGESTDVSEGSRRHRSPALRVALGRYLIACETMNRAIESALFDTVIGSPDKEEQAA